MLDRLCNLKLFHEGADPRRINVPAVAPINVALNFFTKRQR